MKIYSLLQILSLILILTSCENKKDGIQSFTFHNEFGEFITYELKGNTDSIIFREDKGVNWVKKIYAQDSLYMWNYENDLLISEGLIHNEEAMGKWKFYKGGALESIKEFIQVNGKQYMNQVWHFSKTGDTLKNKGNYYKITYTDHPKLDESITIRFYLEKPLVTDKRTEMIVFYNATFVNKRTGENENVSDKILGIDNEVLYIVSFKDPGSFLLDGYILEISRVDEDTDDIMERRLYFDKRIEINK